MVPKTEAEFLVSSARTLKWWRSQAFGVLPVNHCPPPHLLPQGGGSQAGSDRKLRGDRGRQED
jgi:hypothetical protein